MLHLVKTGTDVLTQRELGERLDRARERAGLSQAELAEAVGLTQSAISRIESGERSVDSLELAAIARRLDVSVLDLLQDRSLPEELVGLARRVETAAEPGAVDQAYERALELLDFDRMLEDLGLPRRVEPMTSRPKCSGGLAKDEGRRLAEEVREDLGLAGEPIPDILEIVEHRVRLDVALEPLPDGVEGLCVRVHGFALVLVNSAPVVGRRRFSIAHELGHFMAGDVDGFHVDESLSGRGTAEIRANAFAAHLLMPESGLEQWIGGREIDERTICGLQYTFGVSLEALLWHLQNLDLISEHRRRTLRKVGAKSLAFQHGFIDQWRTSHEGRGRVRPPGDLYRRAVDAYQQGLIGAERLARLLGYDDPEELRRELEDAGITSGDWPEDTASA